MNNLVVLLGLLTLVTGSTLDGCQSPDPNCHPSCVVYDASHCRLCRCPTEGSGGPNWKTESASGTEAEWNKGFNGDWSQKNSDTSVLGKVSSGSSSWENTGSSHGDGSHETTEVRYVFVEKASEVHPSALGMIRSPFMGGSKTSFSFPSLPRASSLLAVQSLLPGYSHDRPTIEGHSSVFHVPLIAPGQPRYCIRCHILSCPSTCERVDEYGCHSCPCAPSNSQAMPVMKDCANGPSTNAEIVERMPDCRATQLCISTCKDGYKLGATGSDGCRECSCIKNVLPTPKAEDKGCPATISCMLKCKDGYVLGGKRTDGCPSCRCLARGVSIGTGNNANGNSNGFTNGNSVSSWSMGGLNKRNSSHGGMTDGGGSSNNVLSSTNGIGNGDCKPPMCLDGKMSVNQAMKLGTDSANGRYTPGMTSMTSGGSVGNGGNCFPMCAGGSNNQFKGGSSSSSVTMAGGGSGGCSGPFCSTMSGIGSRSNGMGGGGSRMGGGSNIIGGGSKGMTDGTGMARGMGMAGGAGSGTGGSGRPFSPFAASMTGGSSRMGIGGHKDCPNLIHCLVTCDGNTLLGDLDQNGCQTCSCV